MEALSSQSFSLQDDWLLHIPCIISIDVKKILYLNSTPHIKLRHCD